MRILYVITELAPAGAENVLATLGCGMKKFGHDVKVVSLCAEPKNKLIPNCLMSNGISVCYLNGSKTHPFAMARALAQIVRKFCPDLVHSHLMHANLLSRIALLSSKIPLVNTIHIAEKRLNKKLFFLLDRLTLNRCDAYTGVSQAAVDFHAAQCHVDSKRFHVIYNGIEPVVPASKEEQNTFLKQCGLESCTRIFGSIGRLAPQKGFERIFTAFPELSSKIPSGEIWGFLLIGEGTERHRLEKLALRYSYPNIKVAMSGYRENAKNLLPVFDVFLMPSVYEGYGLALAEAMSFGIPVITSNCDSLPELNSLYSGFHTEIDFRQSNSASRFAVAIQTAMNAKRGNPFIHTNVSEMIAKYQTLYQTLIS